MPSKPEISVVLPVWNAECTIKCAVQSILSQTLRNFELLVIDDGSTDRTPEILDQVQDKRVQVVRTEHQGVAGAANLGNRLAKAAIIARMDADDTADPQRLACQLAHLQQHGLDVVGSRVQIQPKNGRLTKGMARYEQWINKETISSEMILALRFVEFPLVNPSIMARRSYYLQQFSDNSFPEDYDLMLRAARSGMRFGKTPESLLQWNDSPNRLTRTDVRYSRQAFMDCRQYHLKNGPLLNISTVDLWGAGRTGKPWLRWLHSENIKVRNLIEVSTRKQGQLIHNVRVVPPESIGPPDGTPLVVCVGAAGARPLITEFVTGQGYCVGEDVWFVA
ncbi:MAG: glycosyltransferase [Fuerstiella sp.]|nr:glycosyltransferase [Fuerstiella sp.]